MALEAIWIQALQVTISIVIVGAVHRLYANRYPHALRVLWVVVLIKCITPPLVVSPSGLFCWLRPANTVSVALPDASTNEVPTSVKSLGAWSFLDESMQPPSVASQRNSSTSSSHPTGQLPFELSESVAEHGNRPPDVQTNSSEKLPQDSKWQISLVSCLAVVWGIGLIGRATWQWMHIRRMIAAVMRSRVETCSAWQAEFMQACDRLRLARRPRLVITTKNIGPLVLGGWRPRVVIPQCLLASRDEAFRASIFGHELMHVRQGDLWVCRLQFLAAAVWWFHPLVHWASRRLMESIETSCDEATVTQFNFSPNRYARHLLEVLESKSQLSSLSFVPGVRAWDITSQRLERVMSLRHGGHKRALRWSWVVALIAAILVLPGGAITRGQDDHQDDSIKPKSIANRLGDQTGQTTIVEGQYAIPKAELNMVQRSYNLRETIDIMVAKQMSSDRDQAMTTLEQIIQSMAGPQGTATRKGDVVEVVTDEAKARSIAAELKAIERYGLGLVLLEVKMIHATDGDLTEIYADWDLLNSEFTSRLTSVGDESLEARTERRKSASTTVRKVVEETTLVRRRVFQPEEVDEFLSQIKSDRFNLLIAPRVLVRNGRTTSILDATQQVFAATAEEFTFETDNTNEKTATTRLPVFSIIESGLALTLRPEIISDNSIWLDGEIAFAEVLDAEERKVTSDQPDRSGQHEITLRLPKIARTVIETATEIPFGGAFAIAGIERVDNEGKRHELMILVRCLKPTDEQGEIADKIKDTESR